MIWLLMLVAVGLAAVSLLAINRIDSHLATLDSSIKTLDESIKNSPYLLRKKLNRLLLLQKRLDGETVPSITFQKSGKSAPILYPWETVFATAQDEGLGLSGTCEGNGDCGLCAISIISGNENLSPLTAEEDALLKKLELPAGVRLSCQSRAKGNIVVDFLQS